jgi:glycosyltransferase involved in cell wall biosynthesis
MFKDRAHPLEESPVYGTDQVDLARDPAHAGLNLTTNGRQRERRTGSAGPGRLRLVVTIGSLEVGGSEKQVTELLTRLPKDRVEPVLVLLRSSGATRYSASVLASGVPIIADRPVRGPRTLGAPARVRWYGTTLRTLKPDLVYAWLDECAALMAPICRRVRIPCVVARRNVTGSALEQRQPAFGRVLRRLETRATLVTANSLAVAHACAQRGHSAARIRVVPNGHEQLPRLAVPSAPPVVFAYVANFRPEKGHVRLLEVLRRVPRGSWRVDLAGGGPLLSEIQARIIGAGLGEVVRVMGPVSDIRGFWRERHAALLLSDSEGSPNALLEAAVAGRPVIATDVGGSRELVGSGGVLVSPDDPDAAARAIAGLVADPARRERLGSAIWHHVIDAHSTQRMVAAHMSVLEEAHALAHSPA